MQNEQCKMNTQANGSNRPSNLGWWISFIVISTLAALPISVIVYSAATGSAPG